MTMPRRNSMTHKKLLMMSVVILVDVFKFLKRLNFSENSSIAIN